MEKEGTYLVEKDDAKIASFDTKKDYLVVKDFNMFQAIGTCRFQRIDDKLFATIKCRNEQSGYPAIAYTSKPKAPFSIMCLSICMVPNIDPTIPYIELK